MAITCEVCDDMRKFTGSVHAVVKVGIGAEFEQQLIDALRKKNLAWRKHLLESGDGNDTCLHAFITSRLGLNPPGRPRKRTTPTEE